MYVLCIMYCVLCITYYFVSRITYYHYHTITITTTITITITIGAMTFHGTTITIKVYVL